MPLPRGMLRTVEIAWALALHDLAAGKPAEAWRTELHDMARAGLALAEQGIGIEATDLADRALQALDAGDPAAHLPLQQDLLATVLGQLRACNWRQFRVAQQRVRRWGAA